MSGKRSVSPQSDLQTTPALVEEAESQGLGAVVGVGNPVNS